MENKDRILSILEPLIPRDHIDHNEINRQMRINIDIMKKEISDHIDVMKKEISDHVDMEIKRFKKAIEKDVSDGN